jgi:hypothetical protein
MAKIVQDVLTIKFSRIVRTNDADNGEIAGDDIRQALEQVAQELVGDSVVVEVERE